MKDRPRDVFEVFEPVEPGLRIKSCAWPDCAGEGTHRAPVSRERIEEYQWFCLDHVRIYNSAWNYYVGMSDAEVEAHIRADGTWNRPTWPLGDGPLANGRSGSGPGSDARTHRFEGLHDPFGFLQGEGGAAARQPALSPSERRAFDVLDLDYPVTFEEVKAQYKALVKRHHPDANGGAKDAEERLKRINEAYKILKTSHRNGQKNSIFA